MQMLMERKKSDTEAFNRSVTALYKTRMIDDPDERAAMLSTGATRISAVDPRPAREPTRGSCVGATNARSCFARAADAATTDLNASNRFDVVLRANPNA
jgi:hypothetical protein